ncbi:GtrA family protein [Flavihumibacter petaseus]|uniref:GtrA/DPMS transmembrane domain-containing protein n=1 Tax=Flavihumibacter petaseus NBRC 106054 TaxID=1220578 RepID=A0A0E9N6Q0_9BACT|nr:GtrA family protein [Flavihumibacter petaseus]GAO45371.1 hypothetical protein FPE01S_05_00680 [Flavihumibacter petaseus NBRC 106054]
MVKGLSNFVTSAVDFFYPPFRRILPVQTFRYLACGGANTLFDILVFFFSLHFIVQKSIWHTGLFVGGYEIAFQPHTLSVFIAFLVSFPTGFFLMRTVVFHDSDLRGRVQLFRYLVQVLVCLVLNVVLIKLFVEVLGFYPTISKILTTVLVVTFSYLSQRYFTFRKKLVPEVAASEEAA